MTKVSIIIPCYKQAHFLAQAVDSCLAQTHSDVEIIVVDDGSPDDTAAVAGRYAGRPGFRYIRQNNTGLPGARNRGIAEATGDYICFLDSDDWYAPEKIARQAALLDANPALGWVYCDVTSVDESGRPLSEQFSIAESKRLLSGNLFDSLIHCGYFQPHTVMIRRGVLDQVGVFDPELGGYADYDLWLRVAGAGFDAVFVPERLAYYRIHSASMSRDGQHMNAARLGAFRKVVALFPERAARGLARLQQAVIDHHESGKWKSQVPAAPSADLLALIQERAELTIRWRSKLEAGVALASLKQSAAAAKFMIEAVQSVQTCAVPEVIIEALIETSAQLAPLDIGRARYLLNLGRQLAADLGNQPACARAEEVLASFPATPAGRPRPAVPQPASA
jgi:GT2 family glycosyltransferase